MPEEKELGRLIAEALREEASAVTPPPVDEAWERFNARWANSTCPRPWRWLVPLAGAAAALVLVLGTVLLTGPAGLSPFQAWSDRAARLQEQALTGKGVTRQANPPGQTDPARGQPGALPDGSVAAAGSAGPGQNSTEGRPDRQTAPDLLEAVPKQPASGRPQGAGPCGRNGSATAKPPGKTSGQGLVLQEVDQKAPFPLPTPTLMPADLHFKSMTLQHLNQEQAVAHLVYEGGMLFMRLKVSNTDPDNKVMATAAEEPSPEVKEREVQLKGIPCLLRVRRGLTRLSWKKGNLYLEMETNLEPERAMEIAESLKWD